MAMHSGGDVDSNGCKNEPGVIFDVNSNSQAEAHPAPAERLDWLLARV